MKESLLEDWVRLCQQLAETPADLYSGCRKIIRNQVITFPSLDNSLKLHHAGYTPSKLKMLQKNYLHAQSKEVAIDLWELRLKKAKYGSVGFTCFNHFVKNASTVKEAEAKRSKRASVFGPCILAVTITWLSRKRCSVDVYYRTTEAFKKLAPDLVFVRDILLAGFKLMPETSLTLHFANVTAHPMYAITLLPHLQNPILWLETLKKRDRYFWEWIVKWTSRYLVPERHNGIAKFSQALRVKKDALDRLDPKVIKSLQSYLRKNGKGLWKIDLEEEEND